MCFLLCQTHSGCGFVMAPTVLLVSTVGAWTSGKISHKKNYFLYEWREGRTGPFERHTNVNSYKLIQGYAVVHINSCNGCVLLKAVCLKWNSYFLIIDISQENFKCIAVRWENTYILEYLQNLIYKILKFNGKKVVKAFEKTKKKTKKTTLPHRATVNNS